MVGDHDDVVLSDAELERLAAIEANLGDSDPALVARLGRHSRMSRRTRTCMAALLILVGFVVVVATFTRWLWSGVAGLALMTAGVLLVARPLAGRVTSGFDRRSQFPGGSTGVRR